MSAIKYTINLLVTLACSDAPEGSSVWTMQLLLIGSLLLLMQELSLRNNSFALGMVG